MSHSKPAVSEPKETAAKSKRVLVVFETGDALAYAELSDFAIEPQVGTVIEQEGVDYTVTEVRLSPTAFENNSDKKRSGFQKLFAILGRLHPGKPAVIIDRISRMHSIGSGDRLQKSAGGVMLPNTGVLEFDDVVFLCTKSNARVAAKSLDTAGRALTMFAERWPDHPAASATKSGAEDIVLTADAES